MEISSSDFTEVIIIGSGPSALATASRLIEQTPGSIFSEDEQQRFHWLKQRGSKINLINRSSKKTSSTKFDSSDIRVVDPYGRWMGQWDNQFASCSIPHLRSPMFFHPDPLDIDGMTSFAYLNGREKELKEIDNIIGKEFSKHQLKKQRAKNSKKLNHNLKEQNKLDSIKNNKLHNIGLVDINMRNWRDYYRPGSKLFRDYCDSVIQRYGLTNCVLKGSATDIQYRELSVTYENGVESGMGFTVEVEGKIYGCKAVVVSTGLTGDINYPINQFDPCYPYGSCHTSHLFSRAVKDYPHPRIQKKIAERKESSVVVVGGGLTSAQLIHVALTKGVTKAYLLIRSDELKIKHFDFHLDWVTKYKNVKKSEFWGLGSDEERWQMIDDAREGGSVNPEYHKLMTQYVKSGKLEILKKSQIVQQDWTKEESSWDLKIQNKKDSSVRDLRADYIYFATGVSPNINSLKFLDSLQASHPITKVHNLPVLTENLQWGAGEIPLFMVGRNACLRVGPTSANLDGGRLGAERIGWHLQNLKERGKLDWYDKKVSLAINITSNTERRESEVSQTTSIDSSGSEESIFEDTNESDLSEEEADSAFDTMLRLACGDISWFSLLDEENA